MGHRGPRLDGRARRRPRRADPRPCAPGSVVLLHDGPAVTPELLDLLLRGLHERSLRAVRLDELPPQRIGWRAGLGRLRQSYGG
ncbi:hypothetical protein MSS93_13840 [Deinococcus radiodurans]|nr:hypothetical protein MSS93_13840 [Deinococcus radiodurans]